MMNKISTTTDNSHPSDTALNAVKDATNNYLEGGAGRALLTLLTDATATAGRYGYEPESVDLDSDPLFHGLVIMIDDLVITVINSVDDAHARDVPALTWGIRSALDTYASDSRGSGIGDSTHVQIERHVNTEIARLARFQAAIDGNA